MRIIHTRRNRYQDWPIQANYFELVGGGCDVFKSVLELEAFAVDRTYVAERVRQLECRITGRAIDAVSRIEINIIDGHFSFFFQWRNLFNGEYYQQPATIIYPREKIAN